MATVQIKSPALGKRTSYHVILPEIGEGPFPVVLQLHGLSDDGGAWLTHSNRARYAEAYPFIIVLPDGGTSGYLNWLGSGRLHRLRYEDFLIEDLVGHVRRCFNVRPGPWAIGGLSMGGYGAMRLGLKFPERFASIWAHSSAFHIHEHPDPALVENLADADVFSHAATAAANGTTQAIAFDCGVDDELIGHNRRLHAQMEASGLPHHYAEHPGGHTWDYWDRHVRTALDHHLRVLRP